MTGQRIGPLVLASLLFAGCTAMPPPREWGRGDTEASDSTEKRAQEQPAPEPIESLDWAAALHFARAGSPSLRAARVRIARAEALLEESRALAYPRLDARANYVRFLEAASFRGRIGGDGSGQTTRSRFFTGRGSDIYSAGVDLSYSLFDGGEDYYDRRAAASALEATRLESDAVLDELELVVSTAFLNALLAEGVVRISEDALGFTEEQEAQARAREEAGEGLRVDTLRFATRASEEQLALNRAQAEMRVQVAVLSELLGMRLPDDVELVRPETLLYMIEGDLVELALDTRADVRALQARIREARAAIDREEARWWPVVDLFGSYGVISLDDVKLADDEDELSVGGVLSWNLFEGGATTARVEARRQELEELHEIQRELRLVVEREVRQFELELEVAMKNVEVSRETVELAEEVLTRVTARYREGEAQVLDVTEAELQRTRAQLAFLRSRVNSVLSQARLRRAIGIGLLRE